MKNILMIDLGREYGGSEKVVENLFFGNYGNDINMHLACLKGTKLATKVVNSKNKNYILLDNSKKNIFKSIINLCKYVKRNRIDIIHCHGVTSELVGVTSGVITKTKILTTIHSRADFDTTNKLKGIVYCNIQKYLSYFNKKYIVVSKDLEQFFLDKKMNKKKLIHIDNSIKDLKSTKNREKNKEVFTICSVGRLTAVKAHEKLLLALSEINKENINFKCLLAGDGELKEHLKQVCIEKQIDDKVEFLGFINDVTNVFNRADCLIMQSDMEGLPMVLLEAMSYKLPIIAHNVGGISTLLDDKTSVLFYENEPHQIAEKIKFAYYNKNRLEENAERAFKVFKDKYDLNIFLKKYGEIYLNI